MKKLRMDRTTSITLEEGCQLYLNDCRQRNLREATINHYRQSYLQMFKAFDPQMPLNEITIQTYNEYVIFLKKRLTNDILPFSKLYFAFL
ncbi:MAG: phage integrase SAM-like domain-containing protein [Clostridia bacterium]|nr:phage integrase SAM-like domain-containing protein [Clostridia bacterium]